MVQNDRKKNHLSLQGTLVVTENGLSTKRLERKRVFASKKKK